jgi:dienelactone hydrolase
LATVALFHSVLGMRPGIHDAAERLRGQGHEVLAVDQYDGRVFDDYAEAGGFASAVGYPELMRRAEAAVGDLTDGFLCLGFSNGGGMSEYVVSRRRVGGVVLCSGALPLQRIGIEAWPSGVPAQIHYTLGDPFRTGGQAEAVAESIAETGSDVQLFDYPGRGHLFTDASLPEEYDPEAAEQLWQRVYAFCVRHG